MGHIVQQIYFHIDENGNKVYDREEMIREFLEKLNDLERD